MPPIPAELDSDATALDLLCHLAVRAGFPANAPWRLPVKAWYHEAIRRARVA